MNYKLRYLGKRLWPGWKPRWDLRPGCFYTATIWSRQDKKFFGFKNSMVITVFVHTKYTSGRVLSYPSIDKLFKDWELLGEVEYRK